MSKYVKKCRENTTTSQVYLIILARISRLKNLSSLQVLAKYT